MVVKEGKQAEFLISEAFPWALVEKIGVMDEATLRAVTTAVAGSDHKPLARVEPEWYF